MWFLAVAVITIVAVGAIGVTTMMKQPVPNADRTLAPVPTFTYAEPAPTRTPTVVAATNGRSAPVALVLGDSYSAGVGASTPEGGWPALVGANLGWDMEVLSAPGGGYSLPGTNGQSIVGMFESTDIATLQPNIVIIQSGYNDTSAQDEDVRAAIGRLQDDLRAQLPDTPVVVVGQFWPGEPTPSSTARAATIQRAWSGYEGALVLDPIAEGWSTFNTTDDRHPDDAGHALIAERIVAAIRSAGLVG